MPSLTRLALVAAALSLYACNCSRSPTKDVLRPEGDPCTEDGDCESNLCFARERGKGTTCGRKCTTGCETTEVCTQLGFNRYGCVPNKGAACTPCETNNDCPYAADSCIVVNGAKVCGQDCSFDGTCAADFRCAMGRDTTGNEVAAQCQPKSGTCGCNAASYGQTLACSQHNDAGVCLGEQTCGPEGYSACTAQTPALESCDGVDNDCNGMTDEGLGDLSCGVGECRRATSKCVNGMAQTCTAGSPISELCNSKDDDCDGVVDNGIAMNTVMACGSCSNVCTVANGVPGCGTSGCFIASCTGAFRDCGNGYTDGCETNTDTSLQHCGGCNQACDPAGATGTCASGQCTFVCTPGHIDLDGVASNGCEYACTATSSTDLPDFPGFVDANCDGIDGEIGNAVFVAPPGAGGNDANLGTRAQPKATIDAALITAQATNKRDVYVAAGTYIDAVHMLPGKGVYGGYLGGTWARATGNISSVAGPSPALVIQSASDSTVQLMSFLGGNATNVASGTAYGARIVDSANVKLQGVFIRSGDAGNGADGVDGVQGGPGGPGVQGNYGREEDGTITCSHRGVPAVVQGGTSVCGRTGGAGGASVRGDNDCDPFVPGPQGCAGQPGVGGTPGGAGTPSDLGNSAVPANATGGDGAGGTPGANGSSGAAIGTISSLGYLPAATTDGQPGTDGNGGGGGGGGGGGDESCHSYGGTGGSGGAGGCAGTIGTRGMSGGASVGVFLWASSVTATGCTVQTGRGGTGGRGGAGGPGGMGGSGGPQNAYGAASNQEQDDASNGGPGGRGGDGGGSGAGGAGAGGPSIGALRGGGATWSAGATTYTLGMGGTGGTSNAGNGANGLAQDVY